MTLQVTDKAVYFAEQSAADDLTTPSFDLFYKISGSPTNQTPYTESAIIDPSGQAPDQVIDGSPDLAASFETEFTDQMIPFIKKAIHGNETLTDVTGTDISFTLSGVDSGASNAFASLEVGDFFYVSGTTNNNGWHRIETKNSDNDVITSTAPNVEGAGASVTVFSRKVTSGKTRYYDIIQERVKDTSQVGDLAYQTSYNGSINNMTIAIGENGIIGTTLEYMFEKRNDGYNALAGQTDNVTTKTHSYSAVSNVKNYFVNGESYKCQFKSMEISIENGYEQDSASACFDKVMAKSNIRTSMAVSTRTPTDNPFRWDALSASSANVSFAVLMQNNDATKDTLLCLDNCKVTDVQPQEDGTFANTSFTAIGQASRNQDTTITMYNNF